MRVVATDEAIEFVREHGGRLWVWPTQDRRRYVSLVALRVATHEPRFRGEFAQFDGGGFDLLLDDRGWGLPEFLEVEIRGRRRRRVEAFWNGRVYLL